MPTQPMTKFMSEDWLVLKAPSTEQLETVLAWLAERSLNVIDSMDTDAVFTKSGKGKSAAALALRLGTEQHNQDAIAKMQTAYPAPKSLAGICLTPPSTSEEQAEGMDGLADDLPS